MFSISKALLLALCRFKARNCSFPPSFCHNPCIGSYFLPKSLELQYLCCLRTSQRILGTNLLLLRNICDWMQRLTLYPFPGTSNWRNQFWMFPESHQRLFTLLPYRSFTFVLIIESRQRCLLDNSMETQMTKTSGRL